MPSPGAVRQEQPPPPPAIHARALDELSYIRRTMEQAGSFTSVSGWAMVAIGLLAVAAAWVARGQRTPHAWLAVWFAAAPIAIVIGCFGMLAKARATGASPFAGPARRFAARSVLPLFSGGALTLASTAPDWVASCPAPGCSVRHRGGVWRAFSVRIVRDGVLLHGARRGRALIFPSTGDWFMALGFGGLLIGFGLRRSPRRHGG
jgi:hypothetical protein